MDRLPHQMVMLFQLLLLLLLLLVVVLLLLLLLVVVVLLLLLCCAGAADASAAAAAPPNPAHARCPPKPHLGSRATLATLDTIMELWNPYRHPEQSTFPPVVGVH